jgi:hypothetical protein
VAVDEGAATITVVAAAVADGAEMPNAATVPEEPAGRMTASVVGAATGAAAAAAAAAARTWQLLRQLSCPCFAGALTLDVPIFFFPCGLVLAMVELFWLKCELLKYKLHKERMQVSMMWWCALGTAYTKFGRKRTMVKVQVMIRCDSITVTNCSTGQKVLMTPRQNSAIKMYMNSYTVI